MKLQECTANAKLPSQRKSRLSRDVSHENAKPAVKFTASWLRGLYSVNLLSGNPERYSGRLLCTENGNPK